MSIRYDYEILGVKKVENRYKLSYFKRQDNRAEGK